MPRRLSVVVPAILICSAVTANAQQPSGGVDSRVELMSILFRLAGNSEYQKCRVPAYCSAIDSHFAPYRGHEAVRLARSLGIGYDAPIKLAVYLSDASSLDERVPFDRASVHLYAGWDAAKARTLLAAVRRFVADSKFQNFVRSQQPLYDATNDRLRSFLRDRADAGWFNTFFGAQPGTSIVIVPGLANGAASYAARFSDGNGGQEIYAVPGVSKVDASGVPVFDSDWRLVMADELAHVYTSPLARKFAAGLQKPARQIYTPVAPAMRQQSYTDSWTVLTQSLARAVAIEFLIEHDGQEAARAAMRKEKSRSFFWVPGLVKVLDTYRAGRDHYPSFDSFMPQVVQYFANTAPRIDELTGRFRPKVLSASIAEGAKDVDPSTKQIVVRFSMPMSPVGPNKSAKFSGGRFDSAATSVTIPVTLEPDRDYAIPIRWSGGQAFLSADGVPLPAITLRFRTAPASPRKKP